MKGNAYVQKNTFGNNITVRKRGSLRTDLIKNKWLYIMFLLPLIWYLIFAYLPMFGIAIAFQNFNLYKGFFHSSWVGFHNFIRFFNDPYCLRLIRNTVLLSVYGMLWGFPIPILIALAFNEMKNGIFKKTTQTISYLPHFISAVIVCSMAVNFLSPSSGLINAIRGLFGFGSIYYLQDPKCFRTILISMGIWQGSGFSAILYLAAIAGIPVDQYEAAIVDGANKMQQIWHVTLPGMLPTIVIMLIMNVGSILSVGYDRIILMYNPYIYETADVLSTYVYRLGLQSNQYSYAEAITMFQNIIGFVLVFFTNKLCRKLNDTSLW
jgi:putative aldouronate transport system permease protein